MTAALLHHQACSAAQISLAVSDAEHFESGATVGL